MKLLRFFNEIVRMNMLISPRLLVRDIHGNVRGFYDGRKWILFARASKSYLYLLTLSYRVYDCVCLCHINAWKVQLCSSEVRFGCGRFSRCHYGKTHVQCLSKYLGFLPLYEVKWIV